MGASAPSPPTPPDPVATASAQGASNVATAAAQTQLNNINQVTPYGSLTYTQSGTGSVTNPDGSVSTFPTYTSTQTMSPLQQQIFDQSSWNSYHADEAADSALETLKGTFANPVTADSLQPLNTSLSVPSLATGYDAGGNIRSGYDPGGAIQTGYASGGAIQGSVPVSQADTTFGATGSQIQYDIPGSNSFTADRDAATNAALARLQPTMDQSNAALQASLANQGVSLGSSAYGSAMYNQAQANNDLRLGAVATGDAEQQALFGEAAQAGAFHNAAQQQDYLQQQGRGQFQQQGTALNNASALAAGQFANAAQAQGETENAARAAFGNAAQGQQNQENAAAAAFSNQAQAQQNSQNQQAAAFGNSAAQGLFGMNQAAATFGNQAREQDLTDQETINNNSVNQISALMHGGQATAGQYQGYTPGQIGTTPISQDTYASAQLAEQNYQTESQAAAQNNAAMFSALGGLFGMGGKMFGMSDRRLKRDVIAFGPITGGLPVYAFRYAWDRDDDPFTLGHMADEVAAVRPDAVHRHPSGFDMVDYGAL